MQLVTHERDILKKDVKRISLERDGAYKHLSLTTAVAAHAASQVAHGGKSSAQQSGNSLGPQNNKNTSSSIPTSPNTMENAQHHDLVHGNHNSGHKGGHQLISLSAPHHHHRTASDTGTAAPSPSSMTSSTIGKTGRHIYYLLTL